MVAYVCNFSMQEDETGGLPWVQTTKEKPFSVFLLWDLIKPQNVFKFEKKKKLVYFSDATFQNQENVLTDLQTKSIFYKRV